MKSTYKITNGTYSYIKEFKNTSAQVYFIAYGLKAGMTMERIKPIKTKTEAEIVKEEGRG